MNRYPDKHRRWSISMANRSTTSTRTSRRGARENALAALFSAKSVRRSIQTESGAKHPESMFEAVSRVQNHSKPVAHSNYEVRSKAAAQADFDQSQNVRANDLICRAAIRSDLLEFSMTLSNDFPSREKAGKLLRNTVRQNMRSMCLSLYLLKSGMQP